MPDLDISKARSSDMENWTATAVTPINTDGISDLRETDYTNSFWTTGWGFFNQYPDLKSALILKTSWIVGKGYTADITTEVILDNITGYGKETFEDILFNMDLIKRVGRDSFAEIVRNEDGTLINLKPLDPGSIRIVFDGKGIIDRYEQINKVGFFKRMFRMRAKAEHVFQPDEIFHLSNNRLADQIHGVSDIEGLEDTLNAEKESFNDVRKTVHRQAKPFIVFKLKTDDQTKIDELVSKINDLREKGEDLFIPDDENILSFEVVQVNPSQVILEWRNDIRNKFYRVIGLPQIVPGAGGQGTESDSKVIYLAFEQLVEKDQRYIERQVWAQLGVRINLIPPTTLSANLQNDEQKDAGGLNFQPNDTTAGVGE